MPSEQAGSTKTVTLTGWKAVVAIVAVLGFTGFRLVTARQTLDTEGREALQVWVAGDVMRPALNDTSLSLEERGATAIAATKVQIRSISGLGPLDDFVVKVELEPAPDLPAGTELTRYYRMQYSSITGWTPLGSTTSLGYYLAIF